MIFRVFPRFESKSAVLLGGLPRQYSSKATPKVFLGVLLRLSPKSKNLKFDPINWKSACFSS